MINLKNNEGEYPLLVVSNNITENLDIFKILLQNGAKIDDEYIFEIKNKNKLTKNILLFYIFYNYNFIGEIPPVIKEIIIEYRIPDDRINRILLEKKRQINDKNRELYYKKVIPLMRLKEGISEKYKTFSSEEALMEKKKSHYILDTVLFNQRLLKHINSFNIDKIENLEKVLSFPEFLLYK